MEHRLTWSSDPSPETQVIPELDLVERPILICLLGNFRLLCKGRAVAVQSEGKGGALLCQLALQAGFAATRDLLQNTLWPNSEALLAGQSLNSLVYSLHKLLGDATGGAPPVVHAEGGYRLNVEAGVDVDVARFEALASRGDQLVRAANPGAAAVTYERAAQLYRGDLCVVTDVHAILERERLRARYASLLAHLADLHYAANDLPGCQVYARRLLDHDPCREDAHRMVMRCYVRLGERAQALRRYRLCESVLRTEFDAVPEPATKALFDQIRLDPGSIA